MFLNNENQIINTDWNIPGNYSEADTLKLQQLAQVFMKYEISRLNVDTVGNVFIYLADFEALSLVRFVKESEMYNNPQKKWINITNNWYKPKK